jgi:hypothetical protein
MRFARSAKSILPFSFVTFVNFVVKFSFFPSRQIPEPAMVRQVALPPDPRRVA